MPPEKLPEPIASRRGAGLDRLPREVAVEVAGQVVRGRVAKGPVFLESLEGDPVQLTPDQPGEPGGLDLGPGWGGLGRRTLGDPRTGAGWLLLTNPPEDLRESAVLQAGTTQGRGSGQEFVEQDAEGVNIGPGIDIIGPALGLLRTHVLQGAHDRAFGGLERAFGQLLIDRLGDPEVDHLGDCLAVDDRDQDVGGLDIAVDHPFLVSVLDRLANRDHQGHPLAWAQPRAFGVLGDRQATDQLHHEIGPARGGASRVEDPGDVGMVHHRQGLTFVLEPGDDLARIHPRPDDLEGDLAADRAGLLGPVDDAHPASADHLADRVRADL